MSLCSIYGLNALLCVSLFITFPSSSALSDFDYKLYNSKIFISKFCISSGRLDITTCKPHKTLKLICLNLPHHLLPRPSMFRPGNGIIAFVPCTSATNTFENIQTRENILQQKPTKLLFKKKTKTTLLQIYIRASCNVFPFYKPFQLEKIVLSFLFLFELHCFQL